MVKETITALIHRAKFRESEFPNVPIFNISDEIRIAYAANKDNIKNYKENYTKEKHTLFNDFVREYIFILRNTFEIPDDNARFEALMNSVLEPPVTYEEYEKLLSEVCSRRFFFGINDFAAADFDGNGQITWNEIEKKYGQNSKKINRMHSLERTKDEYISLTEFLHCWDNIKSEKLKRGEKVTEKKTKIFKHKLRYSKKDFRQNTPKNPSPSAEDVSNELRSAYEENKDILKNFRSTYLNKENAIFNDYVEEMLYILRNTSNFVPTNEEQYRSIAKTLLAKPLNYTEYLKMLSTVVTTKFGWAIDSYGKMDLDGNGIITLDEIEKHFGANEKKKHKFLAKEMNQDDKISLTEFLHSWDEYAPHSDKLLHKILIVVTNWNSLGNTGRKTGYSLPDLAYACKTFTEAGITFDFVSPRGGLAPADPYIMDLYKDNIVCQKFLESETMNRLENTQNPQNIIPRMYSGVLYIGGIGALFDIAEDPQIAEITRNIFMKSDTVIGTIGFGLSGLLKIKGFQDKEHLIESSLLTTSLDEDYPFLSKENLLEFLPFSLEEKLNALNTLNQKENDCLVHGRLVSGRSSEHAEATASAIVELLAKLIFKSN